MSETPNASADLSARVELRIFSGSGGVRTITDIGGMRAELDRLALSCETPPAAVQPKPFGYVYRVKSQPADEWRFTRDAHLDESAEPGYYIVQPVYDAPAPIALAALTPILVAGCSGSRSTSGPRSASLAGTASRRGATPAANSTPSEDFFTALSDRPRPLPDIIEALTRLQAERRVR